MYGLAQEIRNSIANALETRPARNKPPIKTVAMTMNGNEKSFIASYHKNTYT